MLSRRAAAAARQRELAAAAGLTRPTPVAGATRRAYRADWLDFLHFCHDQDLAALPANPASIALYLGAQVERGKAKTTIARRLSAIAHAHRQASHRPLPTDAWEVRSTMAGIRRTLAPPARGPRLDAQTMASMVAACGQDLGGIRDRALILLGWRSRLSASQLVGLRVEDVTRTRAGVFIRGSQGSRFTEPLRLTRVSPAPRGIGSREAVESWLAGAELSTGPLFRRMSRSGRVSDSGLSTRAISLIVKRAARRAGLDPGLSARSLLWPEADRRDAR